MIGASASGYDLAILHLIREWDRWVVPNGHFLASAIQTVAVAPNLRAAGLHFDKQSAGIGRFVPLRFAFQTPDTCIRKCHRCLRTAGPTEGLRGANCGAAWGRLSTDDLGPCRTQRASLQRENRRQRGRCWTAR